jgi:hypothetical protein
MPVMVLAGCCAEDNKTTQLEEEEYINTEILDGITFVCVAKPKIEKGYYVYVHKETKVIYLVFKHNHNNGHQSSRYSYGYYGITPLLNADGTPMLWEGEL